MYMKYCNARKSFYLETDASGVGLGAALLQVRDNLNCGYDEAPDSAMLWPIAIASKRLSSAEQQYSNVEREALRILHMLEKFHHYCLACEVHVITDHRSLVDIMGKDVAILPQCAQCIILCMHQYREYILYMPDPELFTADWLSFHNHEENKDRYEA